MNTKEHQNIKEHLVLRCGALKSKKRFQETHEDSQKMLRNIKERNKPENVTECQGTSRTHNQRQGKAWTTKEPQGTPRNPKECNGTPSN